MGMESRFLPCSSRRRYRLALLLVLSLFLSLTRGPVAWAGKKAPMLSREKKTLIAGSAFRLNVKKNTADKIISTRWSVNTNATSVLSLSETSRNHAVVSTMKGSQIPQFKARVTAKVDYQAGKKLKTKKLVCVVTVKTTTSAAPVITTSTPAAKTPSPTTEPAPATRTPASPTVTPPAVTPPAVTPPSVTPPGSSATPSASGSPSPSPGTMSSLNVVEQYTKYYVEKESYHTYLSIGFNKAYSQTQAYDVTPSPVPGEIRDTGYWVKNAKSVAQVYWESGNLLKEITVSRVIRPNENKYPNQVILDLGTSRYEGNYRVYLRGFRATGTTESAEDRVFSVNLRLNELISSDGSYRFVDRYSDPTLTHDVTVTLKNWNCSVRSLADTTLSQAELIKHVKVQSGYGETLVIQNIFTDTRDNAILFYVRGGTNATVFRVTFDEVAPYLLWECPDEGVYTAGRIYEVSVQG